MLHLMWKVGRVPPLPVRSLAVPLPPASLAESSAAFPPRHWQLHQQAASPARVDVLGMRVGLYRLDGAFYPWPQMVWGGANRIHLELPLMIDAAFCAAGALIWLGGVLGKASPTQLLWLTVPYVPLYAVNHHLVFKTLGVSCFFLTQFAI